MYLRRNTSNLVTVQSILREKYNAQAFVMDCEQTKPQHKHQTRPSKSLTSLTVVVAVSLIIMIIKTIPIKHAPIQSNDQIIEKPENFSQEIAVPEQISTPIVSDIIKPEEKTVTASPVSIVPAINKPAQWTKIVTQPGDTLARVFNRAGLSQHTLQTILRNNPYSKQMSRIKPHQVLKLWIEKGQLTKFVFPVDNMHLLYINLNNGHYKNIIHARATQTRAQYVSATLRGSLYSTAQHMNIPYKLIRQMIGIFTWELDFSHDVRVGDQFSILYNAFYIHNRLVNTGDILAVMYTRSGKTYQAIRHISAKGEVDYFTPQGTSLKQAFSRYPLQFSHISSKFSQSRRHPILHYNRPHNGIDLAAPSGTPIRATGNGRIALIGRQAGFGNMVKLTHNQGYTSIYGHMLRFQKGLAKGMFVKRGQVIGYVGQSGLANGPHCHYEFHVNHNPKDPATVQLPRAEPIAPRERLAFFNSAGRMIASLKQKTLNRFAVKKSTSKTT